MNPLTLRDMEYIVAVAQHGHFGRAAKQCHVSQPALSAQIKKVEELLGVTLFNRDTKVVTITELGAEFVRQAQVVLLEGERLVKIAAQKHEPLVGTLRVGAIATLGPYLMPHLLAPLRKRFPKLELRIREGHTDKLLEDMRFGRIDAVLLSPPVSQAGIAERELFFEPFFLACSSSHEFADRKSVSRRDLNAARMLFLEEGNCLAEQTLNLCPSKRRNEELDFHATSLETLRHMIALGQEYSLVPALAVDKRMGSLVSYIPFAEKEVGRMISLVWPRMSPHETSLALLADFVRTHVPDSVEARGSFYKV